MENDIIQFICNFAKNPIVIICTLYGIFSWTITWRIVRELADALETIGIKINQQDRIKWRRLINTLLGAIFVAFALCHLYSRLFPS